MHIRYDEGSGPTVVLLHGQPGSASDWNRVVPLLRQHPLRVIAVDRPGYAAARQPATGWKGNADLLLEALERLGVGEVSLVGWSWGGGVALQAALDAPGRIAHLVLVGSVGHELAVGAADRLLAAPGVRQLMPRVMNRLATRGTRLLAASSGSRLDEEATRFLTDETALWPATGAWRSAAREQVEMVRDAARLSAALKQVRPPATVIHGWRDATISIRAAAALASALPTATLRSVDGGHLLPFEHPALLAELIAQAVLAGPTVE